MDKKQKNVTFEIPKKIRLFQYIMKFIVAIFVIIFPITILIIFDLVSLFLGHSFRSFFVQYKIPILIISLILLPLYCFLLVENLFEPSLKTKWFINFQTYFIRRWIIKNIACLKCGKKLDKVKTTSKKPIFFFDYQYICSSCGKKYKPKFDVETKKWKFEL